MRAPWDPAGDPACPSGLKSSWRPCCSAPRRRRRGRPPAAREAAERLLCEFGPEPPRRVFAERVARREFSRRTWFSVVREREESHRRYLLEEVEIIQPRVIAAMGGWAYRILKDWLGDDPRVVPVTHYAAARFPRFRHRFEKDLDDLRRRLT